MSTTIVLVAGLFLLVTVALIWLIQIERRLKRIFRGKRAGDLEDLIREIVKSVHTQQDSLDTQTQIIKNLNNRLRIQGHSVKMMRFNPFPDVGGNQSFAVAITNADGDGVVISSLYSRERMSVFAKPITHGNSDIELSEEERAVVHQAHTDAQQA